MARQSKKLKAARVRICEILRERDLPAYPDSARDAGVGYTDYLTGAGAYAKGVNFATDPKTGENYVYTPARNRQCSIGWHEQCSDPEGKECGCPCHQLFSLLADVVSRLTPPAQPTQPEPSEAERLSTLAEAIHAALDAAGAER